jgi:hypothetical protein
MSLQKISIRLLPVSSLLFAKQILIDKSSSLPLSVKTDEEKEIMSHLYYLMHIIQIVHLINHILISSLA